MVFRELLLFSCSYRLLAQRADLCDIVNAIRNGTIAQDKGLEGIHLHIGSGIYDKRFLRINAWNQYEGLEVDMLDELARLAGFTYSIVIHDWSNLTTWGQALRERIELQDMITNGYFFITPGRMAMGAYSPYGFLDSMLFATVVPPEKTKLTFEEIYSWTKPFSPTVWFSFICLMVGTGLLHMRYLMDSTCKSAGHCSGSSGFSPKTWPGKILLFSWTWCIVLTLSAYTANLASFLVVKADHASGFTSLNSAVAQGRTVSVQYGTPIETWFMAFTERYPGYKGMRSVNLTAEERALMLTREEHDAAIFPKFEVDMLKQRPNVNPRCDMSTIGEPLFNIQAGWMVTNDVKEYCTILVRDVLALWFLRMDLDRTLSNLVKKHLTPVESCPESVEQAAPEATTMEFENMLGILSVHAALTMVALILFCVERCRYLPPPVKAVNSLGRLTLSEDQPRSEAGAKMEASATLDVAIEEPVPREPTALSPN